MGIDQKLTAKNKETTLVLEKTGKLVLYCENKRVIWESGTEGASVEYGLIIQVSSLKLIKRQKTKTYIVQLSLLPCITSIGLFKLRSDSRLKL